MQAELLSCDLEAAEQPRAIRRETALQMRTLDWKRSSAAGGLASGFSDSPQWSWIVT